MVMMVMATIYHPRTTTITMAVAVAVSLSDSDIDGNGNGNGGGVLSGSSVHGVVVVMVAIARDGGFPFDTF